jgi:hypothetical protein
MKKRRTCLEKIKLGSVIFFYVLLGTARRRSGVIRFNRISNTAWLKEKTSGM